MPQTKLENYVRLFHPNGFIKKVLGDGFCVIRAFQEGLSICYNENHKLCDVKAALRSEILRNFDEYSAFSSDKVNVLTELDRFLANPLQYYAPDTVDLFLIALGNIYACNTISAANKDRSTVDYRQSSAFDRPHLSCNDYRHRWIFHKIFFIIIS